MKKKLIVFVIIFIFILLANNYNNIWTSESYKNNHVINYENQFQEDTYTNNSLVIKNITDKTQTMSDFVCAQAIDNFYEDNTYKYYYTCMKSQYVIVEYTNGTEEPIKEALHSNHIEIADLDKYNIFYLKSKKIYSTK